jgi:hypothetical protein
MKKILVILFLLVFTCAFSANAQSVDSCEIVNSIKNEDSLLVYTISSSSLVTSDSIFSKNINMQPKKEKFLNKKRIVILSSLVVLQVAFGFDPKFTAINLVWLLF